MPLLIETTSSIAGPFAHTPQSVTNCKTVGGGRHAAVPHCDGVTCLPWRDAPPGSATGRQFDDGKLADVGEGQRGNLLLLLLSFLLYWRSVSKTDSHNPTLFLSPAREDGNFTAVLIKEGFKTLTSHSGGWPPDFLKYM